MSTLDAVQLSENTIVGGRVTAKLLSELKSGRSSGPDQISPESLMFVRKRLSLLLPFVFFCMSIT